MLPLVGLASAPITCESASPGRMRAMHFVHSVHPVHFVRFIRCVQCIHFIRCVQCLHFTNFTHFMHCIHSTHFTHFLHFLLFMHFLQLLHLILLTKTTFFSTPPQLTLSRAKPKAYPRRGSRCGWSAWRRLASSARAAAGRTRARRCTTMGTNSFHTTYSWHLSVGQRPPEATASPSR